MQSSHEAQRLLLTTTTWWASSALVATALEQVGFAVTVLCPQGHPAWAARITGCLDTRDHPIEALGRAVHRVKPAMIIPLDDRAVYHLHAFHASAPPPVKALIETSIGSLNGFKEASSRMSVLAAAQAEGMDVPFGIPIDAIADLDTMPVPFVLKLDGMAGGQGVRIVRTRAEARSHYRELLWRRGILYAAKRRLMNGDPFWMLDWEMGVRPVFSAQSFVEGRSANAALFCKDGEILGATIGKAESDADGTGPTSFVRVVENVAFLETAGRLTRKLGLSGFCGIDFIIDRDRGVPVMIEFNPRVTPLAAIRQGRGMDPIAAALWSLQGQSTPLAPEAQPRDLHACFPTAWRMYPGDERLERCRDDLPLAHPELIAEALEVPWDQRGLLARFVKRRAPPSLSRKSIQVMASDGSYGRLT